MKILALADLHGDEEILDRLRVLSGMKDYDLVVLAGDITQRGPVSYAEDVLGIFPSAVAVHGNMDPPDVIACLEERGASVHGKKRKFGQWNVAGIGGSNPTPFGTPSEIGEGEIEAVLNKAGVDSFTILVSHPPPYMVFDSVGAMHVGSKAVRKIIEEKKPLLCICGHIHEHEGQEILGDTLVVKVGTAQKFRAAEIDIGDEIDVRFISF
jgi:Icc-related predicted phosphoesterase